LILCFVAAVAGATETGEGPDWVEAPATLTHALEPGHRDFQSRSPNARAQQPGGRAIIRAESNA
jgi:hypothetical protein